MLLGGESCCLSTMGEGHISRLKSGVPTHGPILCSRMKNFATTVLRTLFNFESLASALLGHGVYSPSGQSSSNLGFFLPPYYAGSLQKGFGWTVVNILGGTCVNPALLNFVCFDAKKKLNAQLKEQLSCQHARVASSRYTPVASRAQASAKSP